MNLFLTGITGFCGSHIARRLLHSGHSVWALSRRNQILSAHNCATRGRLTVVSGDLNSFCELPPDIDVVIHAAAVSPTRGARTVDFIRHNIAGTERLVAASAQASVRKFIFFSSLSLYGEIRVPIADENTTVSNPGAYGISKLLGEFLLRDRALEMNSLALRLPAVLGPGASRHWLATITAQTRRGQDIRIFNPDAPFNNAVHIEDLHAFIETLLEKSWSGFDAVTLAADGSLSIREIADRIVQTAGTMVNIHVDPAPQPSFTVSSEKAKSLYGYKPMPFATMLTRYLADFTL